MAMNVGSSSDDGDVMVDINTTPLIDVMLVLLIMLIITIPIQTHAVKMNMPVPSKDHPPAPPTVIRIVVDFDGVINWNGEVIKDRRDLQTRLQQVTRATDQAEVHLEPHKLAPYKFVAEVMAEAQRLGVTKIGIVGNEQYNN